MVSVARLPVMLCLDCSCAEKQMILCRKKNTRGKEKTITMHLPTHSGYQFASTDVKGKRASLKVENKYMASLKLKWDSCSKMILNFVLLTKY